MNTLKVHFNMTPAAASIDTKLTHEQVADFCNELTCNVDYGKDTMLLLMSHITYDKDLNKINRQYHAFISGNTFQKWLSLGFAKALENRLNNDKTKKNSPVAKRRTPKQKKDPDRNNPKKLLQ